MPYKSKRATISTETIQVISAGDVAGLWRQATKVGPYPADDSNNKLAEVMNANRANGAVEQPRPELLKAVDLLLELCQASWEPAGGDDAAIVRDIAYGLLEKSLLNIRPIIASRHQGLVNAKKWYYVPTTVFWSCACGVLKDLGRDGGASRDSVAVKFAVLAAKRMGWMQATTSGLEAFLQRRPNPTKAD
jgi:hypothetical protein